MRVRNLMYLSVIFLASCNLKCCDDGSCFQIGPGPGTQEGKPHIKESTASASDVGLDFVSYFIDGYGGNEYRCDAASDLGAFHRMRNEKTAWTKGRKTRIYYDIITKNRDSKPDATFSTQIVLDPDEAANFNRYNSCYYPIPMPGYSANGPRSWHEYNITNAEFIGDIPKLKTTFKSSDFPSYASCSVHCSDTSNICFDLDISKNIPLTEYLNKKGALENVMTSDNDVNIDTLHTLLSINSPKCKISDLVKGTGYFKAAGNNCSFKTVADDLIVVGEFPEEFAIKPTQTDASFSLSFYPSIPFGFKGEDDGLIDALHEKFDDGITNIEFEERAMYLGSDGECFKFVF